MQAGGLLGICFSSREVDCASLENPPYLVTTRARGPKSQVVCGTLEAKGDETNCLRGRICPILNQLHRHLYPRAGKLRTASQSILQRQTWLLYIVPGEDCCQKRRGITGRKKHPGVMKKNNSSLLNREGENIKTIGVIPKPMKASNKHRRMES